MAILILMLSGMIASAQEQEFRFPPTPSLSRSKLAVHYYPLDPSTVGYAISPPGSTAAAKLDSIDAPLCSISDKNSALMIIDVQDYFVLRARWGLLKENAGKATKLTDEIVKSIEAAKKANLPVILVEYEGVGPTSKRVKDALNGYDKVYSVIKTTDGAFDYNNRSKKDLAKILRKEKVKKIVVTGANGSACVTSTILGALQSNCSVTSIQSAVADFNFQNFIYPYEFAADVEASFNTPIEACVTCRFEQVKTADDLQKTFNVQETYRPDKLESDSQGVR